MQMQSGVDVSTLPKIFQETIQIARDLGIHYLWIDALCIKQDEDLSDWRYESQRMGKVYSNSFLNVSATMSRDGTESLFQERSWSHILLSGIELDVNGSLLECYVFDGDIWSDEIAGAPLNQRGWVFQERFLARRVLHFGENQLGWECNELDALEMFPNGLPRYSSMSSMRKLDIQTRMLAVSQKSTASLDTAFIRQWQEIVSAYSKCELTYSRDKVVAFAGIAERILSTRADHYVAGMWESSIVYDLPWWRSSADRAAFPSSATSFRAPSWSWASVDGEIVFPSLQGGVKATFVDIQGLSDPVMDEGSAVISGGSIRARGVCLPLSIEWLDGDIDSFKVSGIRFSMTENFPDLSMDLEASEQEAQDLDRRGRLLLMPLFVSSYSLYALVLVKIRGVCAYRRLGAVEIEVMKESIPGMVVLDPDAEIGASWPLGPHSEEAAASPVNRGEVVWNQPALKLMGCIGDLKRSSRIVNIS